MCFHTIMPTKALQYQFFGLIFPLTMYPQCNHVSYFSITLCSVLQEKSARLAHLTPQIIRQAKLKAQGKTNKVGGATEDLDLMVHQWAGHVRSLLDASQKANQPWSHTARRLVTSAKKRKGLNKEVCWLVAMDIIFSS